MGVRWRALLCALATACGAPAVRPPPRPEPSRAQGPTVERSTTDPAPRAPEVIARAEVVLAPPGRSEVRVRVELARTREERRQGLMYRRVLEPGTGMLFVFPDEEPRSFWMRNTWLPLDIVFIGADRRIVGIVEDAAPLTDDPRAVEGESQYVLEVRAGFAREYGLGPGTAVFFVNVPEE
jgi:uncharacterized protein